MISFVCSKGCAWERVCNNGCVCSKGSVCSKRAQIEYLTVADAFMPDDFLADRCAPSCVVKVVCVY